MASVCLCFCLAIQSCQSLRYDYFFFWIYVVGLTVELVVCESESITEDSPSDSDKIPSISQAPPHQSRRRRIIVGNNCQSKTLRPAYISAKRKGKRRRTEDSKPEPENERVVDDRTQRETDEFAYFLYILALCALIFFVIFLFLLSFIFLFFLYVVHLSYRNVR